MCKTIFDRLLIAGSDLACILTGDCLKKFVDSFLSRLELRPDIRDQALFDLMRTWEKSLYDIKRLKGATYDAEIADFKVKMLVVEGLFLRNECSSKKIK